MSIIWPPQVRAKTITLDDSGTQALEPSVSLKWKNVAPTRSGRDNAMVGTTILRVRINVLPWLRRTARIYLNLPAQPPGPIDASWSSQGRILPGQVHSGGRVLVYSGPITTPFIEDVMTVKFRVDGTQVRHAFPVTFHFEMDEG